MGKYHHSCLHAVLCVPLGKSRRSICRNCSSYCETDGTIFIQVHPFFNRIHVAATLVTCNAQKVYQRTKNRSGESGCPLRDSKTRAAGREGVMGISAPPLTTKYALSGSEG